MTGEERFTVYRCPECGLVANGGSAVCIAHGLLDLTGKSKAPYPERVEVVTASSHEWVVGELENQRKVSKMWERKYHAQFQLKVDAELERNRLLDAVEEHREATEDEKWGGDYDAKLYSLAVEIRKGEK